MIFMVFENRIRNDFHLNSTYRGLKPNTKFINGFLFLNVTRFKLTSLCVRVCSRVIVSVCLCVQLSVKLTWRYDEYDVTRGELAL